MLHEQICPARHNYLTCNRHRLVVWVEEQPLWFDAYAKSKIPDWMVNNEDLFREIRDEEVITIISERRVPRSSTRRSFRIK